MIKIAPYNPVAYTQMGRVYLMQRKEKDAVAEFEKALSLQPNYLEPLQFIVSVFLNKKDTKKALDRVRYQIAVVPKDPFLYCLLGKVFEANKDNVNAENNFKKAIDIISTTLSLPSFNNTAEKEAFVYRLERLKIRESHSHIR